MYTPASDEKLTPVMLYTQNSLLRGEVVTKESARVSTWLRTQGAPRYIHLLNVSAVQFNGIIKSANYAEVFLPIEMVIALHLTPPHADPPDYDEHEANRAMQPVITRVGGFEFKGFLRVSAQAGIGPSLELSKVPWLSIYELEISSPVLPQMPVMRVPLAILNPTQVYFSQVE